MDYCPILTVIFEAKTYTIHTHIIHTNIEVFLLVLSLPPVSLPFVPPFIQEDVVVSSFSSQKVTTLMFLVALNVNTFVGLMSINENQNLLLPVNNTKEDAPVIIADVSDDVSDDVNDDVNDVNDVNVDYAKRKFS